jgi:DNA polymerase-3 subunit gamma/tau
MSDYIPLDLKHRPRKLEDLVGVPVLTRTLTNAIKAKRLRNTFLFIGAYGCGKTSAARVLAACLNNPGGESATPKACARTDAIIAGKSIDAESNATDVIEMDGASTRGIDDIKDIRKEASYHPTSGKYKIFIIDEVHGLTPQAFESFLKLLEEPPSYCKFFLCTTEANKLKPTILSRCQSFNFSTLPWNAIAAHLKGVCQKEGLTIEDGALKLISKFADGHIRDSLKHLDSVVMYAGEGVPLTTEAARDALGVSDQTTLFELIDAVITKNAALGMKLIQTMIANGQTIGGNVNMLLDHLRTLLVIGVSENTAGLVYLTEEEKVQFKHQRGLMKLGLIDDMINNLISIHRGLYYSVNPQVLLEQFLLRSIKTHHRLSQTTE